MARLFVKGPWVLSTFWHLDCYNLCYILKKIAKLYLLEASHRSLKTHHIHRATHYAETCISKIENMVLFGAFYLKENSWHFQSVKYFGKSLLFLKIWHIRVNCGWSYRPSNLLFRFFRYRLGHLDNREKRIAENSKVHFFWKLRPKKCLLKVSRFLTHPPQNDGPLNFLRNWTDNHILMANFSKLRKYQTFLLIELRNLSKGQLADRIFKLWKSCVYDYRVVEHTFFEILTF